jgi:hypothetical protein
VKGWTLSQSKEAGIVVEGGRVSLIQNLSRQSAIAEQYLHETIIKQFAGKSFEQRIDFYWQQLCYQCFLHAEHAARSTSLMSHQFGISAIARLIGPLTGALSVKTFAQPIQSLETEKNTFFFTKLGFGT